MSRELELWKVIKDSLNNNNDNKQLILSLQDIDTINASLQELQQLFDEKDCRSTVRITAEVVSILAENQTVSSVNQCKELVKFVLQTLLSLERAIDFPKPTTEKKSDQDTDDCFSFDEDDSMMMAMIDGSTGYAALTFAIEYTRDVLENFIIPSSSESENNNNTNSMNMEYWIHHFKTMAGLRKRDFEEAKRKIVEVMPIVRTSLGLVDDEDNNDNDDNQVDEEIKTHCHSSCDFVPADAEAEKRRETIERLRQKLRERYTDEFYEVYGSRAIKLGSVFVSLRIQNSSSNMMNNSTTQQKSSSSTSSSKAALQIASDENEGEVVSGSSLPDRVQQLSSFSTSPTSPLSTSSSASSSPPSPSSASKTQVVLVEGPAGVGKTSLCQQLCIEQGFKDALLIFVPLKNLHGIKIEDVRTLLSCCASGVLRGDEMDIIVGKDNNKDNNNNSQIPIMWFMDGFDEVQHTTNPALANFLKNFVDPRTRALHAGDPTYKNLVRDCDLVVVSSREERSLNAKSGCNLDVGNVEKWVIMRWSDSEVKQYCTKWFSNVLLSDSSLIQDLTGEFNSASSSSNQENTPLFSDNQSLTGSSSSTVISITSAIEAKIEEATKDVLGALKSNHMEYFAGLPLIVHMLCEIRLEVGSLSHISPSTIFEEMTKLHWNRSKKRIVDRLMRLTKKQQQELNDAFANSGQEQYKNFLDAFTSNHNNTAARFVDENLASCENTQEFQDLYDFVISTASEAGYLQLVDDSHEDVTSLSFQQQQQQRGGRHQSFIKNKKSPSSSFPSSSSSNDLPIWAVLLRETGLLRFSDSRKRGRFPHRSYIEFLCARHAFFFPSVSMKEDPKAMDVIFWSPKFATVWLLIADFVVSRAQQQQQALPLQNVSPCCIAQGEHQPPLTLDCLSAHIALLYTRSYDKLVDRKHTSTTDSLISQANAELMGVPLLLRLSMILASACDKNHSCVVSGKECNINENVNMLFCLVKQRHGVFGRTLRTPRHFLWLAEFSGSVGALEAFKWIRCTYGTDVITDEIASAALSRALDKQDRPSIANFVRVLCEPPYSIPVTLAAAMKVGSLAAVTRAIEQKDAVNNNDKHRVCGVLCRKIAMQKPELLAERARWRQYLAKSLSLKWFDVAATLLRLKQSEWCNMLLDCSAEKMEALSIAREVDCSFTSLLEFIAHSLIPREIQVFDHFTNMPVIKKKDEVLLPALFSDKAHHSHQQQSNFSSFFFNCDDTEFEVVSPTSHKQQYKSFRYPCHDVGPEFDSEQIFLNNSNGWLSIIAALLINESNGVIANHQQQQDSSTNHNIISKRVSKIELVRKTVIVKEDITPNPVNKETSNNNNNNSNTLLPTSAQWRENLIFEDPLFNIQRSASNIETNDDLVDCFNRDVRVRRITFNNNNSSSRSNPFFINFGSNRQLSPAGLPPTMLTHFDISHIDATSALHAGIDDHMVANILKMSPLLTHVDLSFTCGIISDISVKELISMKRNLFSQLITSTNASSFPYLEYLDVSATHGAITDNVFCCFSSADLVPVFSNLRSLRFADCKGKITDKTLMKIIDTQRGQNKRKLVLEDIDCRASSGNVSDKAINRYLEAVKENESEFCPLKRFSCSGAILDSPHMGALAITKAFFVSNSSSFSDNAVGELFRVATLLEHLDVSFTARNISNKAMKKISSTNLKHLDISGTGVGITDYSIEVIVLKSPNLQTFRFSWNSNATTDLSIRAIANNCPNLTCLDMSWSIGVSDSALEAISQKCKKLKFINVKSNGGKIGDRSLIALAKSGNKDLRIINALLTGAKVGNKTIDAFKETNPLTAVKVSVMDGSQDI